MALDASSYHTHLKTDCERQSRFSPEFLWIKLSRIHPCLVFCSCQQARPSILCPSKRLLFRNLFEALPIQLFYHRSVLSLLLLIVSKFLSIRLIEAGPNHSLVSRLSQQLLFAQTSSSALPSTSLDLHFNCTDGCKILCGSR